MKSFVMSFVLFFAPFLAQAQVTYPCSPDPLAGAWPQIQLPSVYQRPDGTFYTATGAANGSDVQVFTATTVTANPNANSSLSGNYAWPWAWQEPALRYQMAFQTASNGFIYHHSPSGGIYGIDYQQLHDAVVLVATTPIRAGIPSGQTENIPALVQPNGTVIRPAMTVPIYTENRYTPSWLPYPANPTRADRVKDWVHTLEASFREGWQDGYRYSPQSAVDKYAGYGFAPEELQAIEQIWLPLPRAGRCVLP